MERRVDATLLAARESELTETVEVQQLPRLAEWAVPANSATLRARFHVVDGRVAVSGRVNATLRLTCQRCLRPVDVSVDDDFHVLLVNSEAELDELPETQDALIANPSQLDLAWMIEEQLLLALPLVPLHANAEQCGTKTRRSDAQVASQDEKQLPFANLRELLKKSET